MLDSIRGMSLIEVLLAAVAVVAVLKDMLLLLAVLVLAVATLDAMLLLALVFVIAGAAVGAAGFFLFDNAWRGRLPDLINKRR